MNETFYVVWNPQAGPPTHRHETYAAALAEARRLARANAGQEFIVLAAKASARVSDPVQVVEFMPEVPF
ncbi:hypothetical protein [Castellaniella sp.]|uniref:hypothetical protein n=1 Tax=Castellaniella sp. TaxID=1955812 RepID=UPI002B001258|nr:hypothetical protein [Castellaniella sp.]